MGGAARGERKRRQARSGGTERTTRPARAARPGASAAKSPSGSAAGTGGGGRRKVLLSAVAVVVLVVAIVGGVLIANDRKNTTEGVVIQPRTVAADYPVRRDGAVVAAGNDDAKVKLDLYEDFLCPVCAEFEAANAGAIEEQVRAGTVQVRYHLLPLLNDASDPPGYSLDSANAALCAADGGGFPAFHASLYAAQPAEGARGYDKDQLIRLGHDVGVAGPQFAACVTGGSHDRSVLAEYEAARNAPYLRQPVSGGGTGFGTPTVAVGQRVVDTAQPQWLANLVSGG